MFRFIQPFLIAAIVLCASTSNADVTLTSSSGNSTFYLDTALGTGARAGDLISQINDIQTDVLSNVRFFVAISQGGAILADTANGSHARQLVITGQTGGDTVDFGDETFSILEGTTNHDGFLKNISATFSISDDADGFANLNVAMNVDAENIYNPSDFGEVKLITMVLFDYEGNGTEETILENGVLKVKNLFSTPGEGKMFAYDGTGTNLGVVDSAVTDPLTAFTNFNLGLLNQSGSAYSIGHLQEFSLNDGTPGAPDSFLMQGNFGAVPEPTSACLFGVIALAGLGYRRRK